MEPSSLAKVSPLDLSGISHRSNMEVHLHPQPYTRAHIHIYIHGLVHTMRGRAMRVIKVIRVDLCKSCDRDVITVMRII